MKKFAILTLLIAIIGSAWGQCTITNPTILNSSSSGGVSTFDLQFKHDRNGGNKWVTIHLWAAAAYPSYDYDRVPTTSRLGGSSKCPFGTVVINNTNVSSSGTYGAGQAYISAYQNDGTFAMLNTGASTLIYNSATDVYTLKNLKTTLPAGTTVIRVDSWSSQSSGNNNVHCYSLCGSIPVPAAMPVTGLQTFQAVHVDNTIKFTWTTYMENHNSHFLVQEYKDSSWIDRGMVVSKYEDGNCDHDTQYQYIMKINAANHVAMGLTGFWPILLVLAFLFRRIVPARLTLLVAVAVIMGVTACNESKDGLKASLETAHTYRLLQVDLDGKITEGIHHEIVKF